MCANLPFYKYMKGDLKVKKNVCQYLCQKHEFLLFHRIRQLQRSLSVTNITTKVVNEFCKCRDIYFNGDCITLAIR